MPPLRLPAGEDVRSLDALAQNEAVALFVARAEAMRHGFRLDADNAAAVVEICVAVDGLPLALELAAARVRQLAPAELAERLGERLAVLTEGPRDRPTRHQALRATIEWSHDLLADEEREPSRRSASSPAAAGLRTRKLFAGRRRGPAATGGSEPRPPRRGYSGCSRRSGICGRATRGGRCRKRSYGAAMQPGSRRLRRRPRLRSGNRCRVPDRAAWLDRLEADYANLRVSPRVGRRIRAPELALRIAVGLLEFWLSRCHFEEGLALLQRALASSPTSRACFERARSTRPPFLALGSGDAERCSAVGEESLALYRSLGDREGIGRTVHLLGQAAVERGERDQGARLRGRIAAAGSGARPRPRGDRLAARAGRPDREGRGRGTSERAARRVGAPRP